MPTEGEGVIWPQQIFCTRALEHAALHMSRGGGPDPSAVVGGAHLSAKGPVAVSAEPPRNLGGVYVPQLPL